MMALCYTMHCRSVLVASRCKSLFVMRHGHLPPWQHGWTEAWDGNAETPREWDATCCNRGNMTASHWPTDQWRRNIWGARGASSHLRWQWTAAWEEDSWDHDAWQGWDSTWLWESRPHETVMELDVGLPSRSGVDARQPLGMTDSDVRCQIWEDAKRGLGNVANATDALSAPPTTKAMFTATVLRPGGFDALVKAGHSPFDLWRRLPDAMPEPLTSTIPAVPLNESAIANTEILACAPAQACSQALARVSHSAEPLQAWITGDATPSVSCQPEMSIRAWASSS